MSSADGSNLPSLVVHLQRDKARALVRAAFPRRKWKIISTRSSEELEAVFRRVLVDAAIIDLGSPDEDTWKAAAFAAEFPSAPFFAIMPLRASDAPAAARCAALGFIDLVIESEDGIEIVDWKTDQIAAATVAERMREYETQAGLYVYGLEAATGWRAKAVTYVFASAEVEASPGDPAALSSAAQTQLLHPGSTAA